MVRGRAGRSQGSGVGPGYHAVYVAHYDRLVRVAHLLGAHRADAEDLVADVFVRTFPHWSAGRVAEVGPYLTRAVVNAVRDVGRRRRGTSTDTELQDTPSLVDVAAEVTERHRLADCLAQLSAEHREVLVLRFYLGFSEAETAATLDLAAGTVKSRQSRAMAALRALMEGGSSDG